MDLIERTNKKNLELWLALEVPTSVQNERNQNLLPDSLYGKYIQVH